MLTEMAKQTDGQFKPGENPNSQQNLKRYQKGQPKLYDELKKRREIIATDTGWDGFKALAKEVGLSASELIERLGRGTVLLAELPSTDDE